MTLHPGNILGYNNEIRNAGSDAAIGHNPGINEAQSIASPAGTVHKGRSLPRTRRESAQQSATAHEEEKTALVAVEVAGGLAVLWLLSR